jgi:hypothetical protein
MIMEEMLSIILSLEGHFLTQLQQDDPGTFQPENESPVRLSVPRILNWECGAVEWSAQSFLLKHLISQ